MQNTQSEEIDIVTSNPHEPNMVNGFYGRQLGERTQSENTEHYGRFQSRSTTDTGGVFIPIDSRS